MTQKEQYQKQTTLGKLGYVLNLQLPFTPFPFPNPRLGNSSI